MTVWCLYDYNCIIWERFNVLCFLSKTPEVGTTAYQGGGKMRSVPAKQKNHQNQSQSGHKICSIWLMIPTESLKTMSICSKWVKVPIPPANISSAKLWPRQRKARPKDVATHQPMVRRHRLLSSRRGSLVYTKLEQMHLVLTPGVFGNFIGC